MQQVKPDRWAIIRGGRVVAPSMPRPYQMNDPETGDILDFPAMTDAERAAAGFVPVEQRNWREIDTGIEQRTGTTLSMENGLPIETHGYRFIPAARHTMLIRIDEQAEALRSVAMTSHPLQVFEYDEAVKEAERFNALPQQDQAAAMEDDWLYLSADIGVTETADGSGVMCISLKESADSVLAAYNLCRVEGAKIRKKRLAAKHLIRMANTDANAFAAYQAAWHEAAQ